MNMEYDEAIRTSARRHSWARDGKVWMPSLGRYISAEEWRAGTEKIGRQRMGDGAAAKADHE